MNSRQRRIAKRQRKGSILKHMLRASKSTRTFVRKHVLALLGMLIPILASFVIYYFAYAEPDLRIGKIKDGHNLLDQYQDEKGNIVGLFSEKYLVKNLSVKSGYISKVEFVPSSLGPLPDIKLVSIDKQPIRWRQERVVEMRMAIITPASMLALAWSKPENSEPVGESLEIRFYDNTGREIATSEPIKTGVGVRNVSPEEYEKSRKELLQR